MANRASSRLANAALPRLTPMFGHDPLTDGLAYFAISTQGPWHTPAGQTQYDIVNTQPGTRYGKIWLLPYHTGKSAAQSHAVGYTWYDDLIVSRARIPDPAP